MPDNIYIKPKKSLGQNFLIDKNIIKKIVQILPPDKDEFFLEIGPGTGALTEELLKKHINLTAVELDKNVCEILKKKFPANNFPGFELICDDIRNIRLIDFQNKKKEKNRKVNVIGNIPYNISADILFWLFEQADIINKAVLMVQKEVAQRICSNPGNKNYGILSVATELAGKAKIAFDISPSCFYPKPKVTSSIIEIKFDVDNKYYTEFKGIMELVKAAFSQRRKILKNSLKDYIIKNFNNLSDVIFQNEKDFDINCFSKRAEQLSKQDYLIMYDYFKSLRK